MIRAAERYMNWLHLQWPAGLVEKLPLSNDDGGTNIPGVYIAGDLRGVPLLKFSADFGARAVKSIIEDPGFQSERAVLNASGDSGMLDLAILGGGIAGMAAGLEARKASLRFEILEVNEAFSTIINFPKGKTIYTYPNEMVPAGDLRFSAAIKELLIDELLEQTVKTGLVPLKARALSLRRRGTHIEVRIENGEPVKALRAIIALGRSGDYREMGIPGENLDKVYNRLHDPQDYCAKSALVVGGGDSALETAVALVMCGAHVTLSYRKKEFSRPKAENIQKTYAIAQPPEDGAIISSSSRPGNGYINPPATPGSLHLEMGSHVKEIRDKEVLIQTAGNETKTIDNDVVFTMLGREAPLEFFRRSAIRIAGEWTAGRIAAFAAFFLFCVALYNWKSGGFLSTVSYIHGWFPFSLVNTFSSAAADPKTFMGTLVISASGPAFWYTLAYSIIVVAFGFRRISRRKTPYITIQTLTLMCIQVIPLFILPEIILPLLGHHGLIPGWLTHALFPAASYGHGYEFWRAYGLILAWPLNVYNVFTSSPLPWWLFISAVQTFVIIPVLIYFWGKGAYCGWICSCGALAETLGDGHRHKMPHGPVWNRLNFIGQVILAGAAAMLIIRIIGWTRPGDSGLNSFFEHRLHDYKWIVDVFLAGAVGYGAYFWLSGRVWCRFMCPLAALMHIYARFSRFRIIPDKKKCISCNMCTGICHQGIDVMSFANKGLPMADPECVRCSACLHICPTGVLTFGMVNKNGETTRIDNLAASPVRIVEKST